MRLLHHLTGNFIFTITRTKSEKGALPGYPKIKRRNIKPNKALLIYKFDTFDNYCEFCKYFAQSPLSPYITKLKNSCLICFQGQYFLVVKSLRLDMASLKNFTYSISEFGSIEKDASLVERKLYEYGKVIMPKDAISTCLKYFNDKKRKATIK